jgi:hypothetical protein
MSQQASENTDLQRKIGVLEADNSRLSGFVNEVLNLTLAAQATNALQITIRLQQLARKIRNVSTCPPGCDAEHPPVRWAAMLGKPRITIYRWMKRGLMFREERDGMSTRRWISHQQMSDFLSRHL